MKLAINGDTMDNNTRKKRIVQKGGSFLPVLFSMVSPLMASLINSSRFYLDVAVSEGALGLSILVSITQKSGNDLMSSIYLITW